MSCELLLVDDKDFLQHSSNVRPSVTRVCTKTVEVRIMELSRYTSQYIKNGSRYGQSYY